MIYGRFPALHLSSKIDAVAGRVSCYHPWKSTDMQLAVYSPSSWEDFSEWERSCSPEYGHSRGHIQEGCECRANATANLLVGQPQGASSTSQTLKLLSLKSVNGQELCPGPKSLIPNFFLSHLIHFTFPAQTLSCPEVTASIITDPQMLSPHPWALRQPVPHFWQLGLWHLANNQGK